MTKPSIQEWDDLYELAIKFNELQPWEWMTDSDVFGVKNPANGKTGLAVYVYSRKVIEQGNKWSKDWGKWRTNCLQFMKDQTNIYPFSNLINSGMPKF